MWSISVCIFAVSCDTLESPGLLSPGSTVRILTKELQHSLDLASATSGDKVVTAQVSHTVNLSPLSLRVSFIYTLTSLPSISFIGRRMRMNRLHLRVENKPQALSVRAPTLEENWLMRFESLVGLFLHFHTSLPPVSLSPNILLRNCVCFCNSGNSCQCDDQKSGYWGRDSSNPGRRETSFRDQPSHPAHNEAD